MAFPTSPTTGDLHTVGTKTYRYDGTDWTKVGVHRANIRLASNSIVTWMIQDQAITSNKINLGLTFLIGTFF